MAAFSHLVVIVEKSDNPEAERHRDTGPHKRVGKIHPQKHGQNQRDENHQPPHRRRAALGQMGLGSIFADRLPLALTDAEHGDELWSDNQADQQRSQQYRARPEGLIAHEIGRPMET